MVRELGEAYGADMFAEWVVGMEEFHTSHPLDERVDIVLLCTGNDLFRGLNSSIKPQHNGDSTAAQIPVEMVAFALRGARYGKYELLYQQAWADHFDPRSQDAIPGRDSIKVKDPINETHNAGVLLGHTTQEHKLPDITYYIEYQPIR